MNFKIRSGELEEGLNFIDIYENEINIGTAEIDYNNDSIFLENIVRDNNYSGKGILLEFIKYLYLKCFSWYKVIFLFLSESCIEVSVHDSFSDKVSCPCDIWSIFVHILHNLIDLRFIKRDDSIIEF